MGRGIAKIIALLAVAATGWWALATSGQQRAIADAVGTAAPGNARITVGDMARAGFPLRIATQLQNITFADQDQGIAFTVPSLLLSSPLYWPADVRLQLPAGEIAISTPHGAAPLTLTTQGGEASIELHQGVALELEALGAQANALSLDAVEGRILTLESLQLDIQQGAAPATYTVDLTAIGLAFGSILQEHLGLPAGFSARQEPALADMTVRFDRPWTRDAAQAPRPQPRQIIIEQAAASLGTTALALEGMVDIDAAGIPTGTIRITLRGWQELFDMGMRAVQTPPDWAPLAQQVLSAMAADDGALDVDVTLENGQMRIGFLPIGPAPRLALP